jgi:hypothetical protein
VSSTGTTRVEEAYLANQELWVNTTRAVAQTVHNQFVGIAKGILAKVYGQEKDNFSYFLTQQKGAPSVLETNRIFYPQDTGEKAPIIYFESDTQSSQYKLSVRSGELIRRLLDNADLLEQDSLLSDLITVLVPDCRDFDVESSKPTLKVIDFAYTSLEPTFKVVSEDSDLPELISASSVSPPQEFPVSSPALSLNDADSSSSPSPLSSVVEDPIPGLIHSLVTSPAWIEKVRSQPRIPLSQRLYPDIYGNLSKPEVEWVKAKPINWGKQEDFFVGKPLPGPIFKRNFHISNWTSFGQPVQANKPYILGSSADFIKSLSTDSKAHNAQIGTLRRKSNFSDQLTDFAYSQASRRSTFASSSRTSGTSRRLRPAAK